MQNIFDYIKWRGDLLLSRDNFNTVDAMILSRLSYIKFNGIFGENDTITLKKAAEGFFADSKRLKDVLWKGDAELLRAAADSKRFGDLALSSYVDIVDGGSTMQFSAMVIDLGDIRFLSYRGTDNTVIGWQEDFSMFSLFPLPSQQKALEYFEKAAKRFDGQFILGGHSKGGNLAVYTAAFCPEDLRNRIDAIYSLDGPGFSNKSLEGSAFDKICERIHTFVPQSSVFGMLLGHKERCTVVRSSRIGLLQHDIYSWEIDGTEPVTLPNTTASSVFFDHTISDFFNGMSAEDKNRLSSGVFEVINSAGVETFDEMLADLVRCIVKFLGTMKNMDKQTRSLILKQLARLLKTAGSNFSDINPIHKKNIKKQHKKKTAALLL